jgi:cytochrome P450
MKAGIAQGQPVEAGRDLQMMTFDMTRDLSLGEGRGQGYTRRQFEAVRSSGSVGVKSQPGQSDIVLFPPHQEGEDMMTQETIQGAIAASMPKPLPKLFHVFNNRTAHMRRAYAAKDHMIMESIQLAIKKCEEGAQVRSAAEYIVRREMISAKKAGRAPDFYSQPLQEELYGYLTAGYETTAAALQWGIKYLAAHQEVQKELRRTLRHALPLALSEARQPTAKELIKAQMPYLDAVVEEVLRLATPIRSIFRVAKMDAMILGHHVPKGTQLILMVYGPDITTPGFGVKEEIRSTSSQSYKDSVGTWESGDEHQFDPERWLKKSDGGNQRFDAQAGPTLAFSAGVRGCFGKRLAYLEMRLLLSLLIWNVELLPLTEGENSFAPMDGLGIKPKQCLARISMVAH